MPISREYSRLATEDKTAAQGKDQEESYWQVLQIIEGGPALRNGTKCWNKSFALTDLKGIRLEN